MPWEQERTLCSQSTSHNSNRGMEGERITQKRFHTVPTSIVDLNVVAHAVGREKMDVRWSQDQRLLSWSSFDLGPFDALEAFYYPQERPAIGHAYGVSCA